VSDHELPIPLGPCSNGEVREHHRVEVSTLV
jgi:hypothetical protein